MFGSRKYEGKCKGKKIERKTRRKEEVKEKKDLRSIYHFLCFLKLISLIFLHYIKLK